MIIDFHKGFTKEFRRQSPKVKEKFKERLLLFEVEEFDPILNNHALKGKFSDYRSINVTGDIRAIYKMNGENSVIFVSIDNHSNLYG